MTSAGKDVAQTITSFLQRVEKPYEFDASTPLFADGIDLDSMEIAELSALLEDNYGSDPFSGMEMPQTVGAILDYYETSAAGSVHPA